VRAVGRRPPGAGTAGSSRAGWAAWAAPIWVAFIYGQWWMLGGRSAVLPAGAGAGPDEVVPAATTAALAAAASLIGHLAGHLVESGFYAAWWRARRSPVRFWRLFLGVASISALDVLGLWLRQTFAADAARQAAWLALLAGVDVLRGGVTGVPDGVWAAFGSAGLLTAARVAATGLLLSAATGRGASGMTGFTAAVWAASRIALWWGVDLLRGRSPLP
jgi:hypothetical protein